MQSKCNIFSRKTNEACSFSLSANVHRVVSRESERYGEFTFEKVHFSAFLLIKVMYSKRREQNKKKLEKKVFQIYSLYGFLSAVVIIHKCYQTYCEFRLKMHFVPINM